MYLVDDTLNHPLPPADLVRGTPAWWDDRYRSGDAPWDTGIVPPEVVALVEGWRADRGWALDLGCGSGVTSRYLAQHGFRVAGVDLALVALSRAARAARQANLPAVFCQGDVADLAFVRVQAVLAIDIGCFHAVAPERRATYIHSLSEHLLPGASYLLYAFEPDAGGEMASTGISPRELALFAPCFGLRWSQHGHDRERSSAWYLWQRTDHELSMMSDP